MSKQPLFAGGRLLLVPAVVLTLAASVADLAAQTVIVTNAPPNTHVEFVLGSTVEASGNTNADGLVTLTADPARLGTRQLDALIFLDVCGSERRVVVVERAAPPPSSGACNRTPLEGTFLVQRISNIVINVGRMPPNLLVRQGKAPPEWLLAQSQNVVPRIRPALGLVAFVGAGTSSFRDFGFIACGDVTGCTSDRSPLTGTAGATYWFTPYTAVEGSFTKPWKLRASGKDANYRFDSELESGLISAVGVGGIPIRRARIFGKAGAVYQRSTMTTRQTVDDTVLYENGFPVLVPGASQTIQVQTSGWGWTVSTGAELWVGRAAGLFVEGGWIAVKGNDRAGGEARIDDRMKFLVGGVRVRLPTPW